MLYSVRLHHILETFWGKESDRLYYLFPANEDSWDGELTRTQEKCNSDAAAAEKAKEEICSAEEETSQAGAVSTK